MERKEARELVVKYLSGATLTTKEAYQIQCIAIAYPQMTEDEIKKSEVNPRRPTG